MASTSSGFGPALPRPGQARLSAQSPAAAPYKVPVALNQRKSTSMPRTDTLHNVSPRHIDCRKRFLEAALAAPTTPSPPTPPPPSHTPPAASSRLESLQPKATSLMPSHFLVDSDCGPLRQPNYGRPRHQGSDPSDLLLNRQVNVQTKLSLWRPSHSLHPPNPGQLYCNPASPYKCSIPGCAHPNFRMSIRSKSPVTEYPLHNVRSPHLEGGPHYHHQPPRPYDHPNLHREIFSNKDPTYSFSQDSSLVQRTTIDSVIKREVSSPPPQSLTQSPRQPHNQGRMFQDTYLADRAEDSHGRESEPIEYRSSYLHHVLHRQQQHQQRSNVAEFLRRHYSSVVTESTSSHQPDEEVSELDQRLRLIEQDSRLHETRGTERSRTPSPNNFVGRTSPPYFRRFSPEPLSPTPIRAPGSVLPLNLSKASGGILTHNDHEEDLDFRQRLSPGVDQRQHSVSPNRETVGAPNHVSTLSPASHESTTPPPTGTFLFAFEHLNTIKFANNKKLGTSHFCLL